MKNKLVGFMVGALLVGAVFGYWFGTYQKESEYLEKFGLTYGDFMIRCYEEPQFLEMGNDYTYECVGEAPAGREDSMMIIGREDLIEESIVAVCTRTQKDYLEKGLGMPMSCGPEQLITGVNLRFDELEAGKELESRYCYPETRKCTSTVDNTKYYMWGYQGVDYRGGEVKIVEAPTGAKTSKTVPTTISGSDNKVLMFNSKYADPADAPNPNNQGGNRVINNWGQKLEDVVVEFDLMFGTAEDNSEDDFNFDLLVFYIGEDYEPLNTGSADFDPDVNHWGNGLPIYITGPRFGDGLRGGMTNPDDPYPGMRRMANKFEPSSIYSWGESWRDGEAVFEYDAGTWYHFKIVTDSEEGIYELYISDMSKPVSSYKIGDAPIRPTKDGSIGGFSQIVIGDPGSAQETDLQEVYLDNFVVKGKCYEKA